MKRDEYKCEMCKGVFTKAWTDAEAAIEYKENFKTECLANVETATVCDNCYKHMRSYYAPWTQNRGNNKR